MTTNQHYLESGERPKVKWARQVDMGMVDKDDMCADGRYGGPKFSPCTHRGALFAAAFLIFSCRVAGGIRGTCGSCPFFVRRAQDADAYFCLVLQ